MILNTFLFFFKKPFLLSIYSSLETFIFIIRQQLQKGFYVGEMSFKLQAW